MGPIRRRERVRENHGYHESKSNASGDLPVIADI
jgi:hypothetical protein